MREKKCRTNDKSRNNQREMRRDFLPKNTEITRMTGNELGVKTRTNQKAVRMNSDIGHI